MSDVLHMFPKEKRTFWEKVALDESQVQEIRLRAGQPILVLRNGEEWFLDQEGHYTRDVQLAYRSSIEEVEDVLQHICHYSLYAYEDELRQGFITVMGGHRIGVAGQAVLEDGGHLRTMKHLRHLNIRLSHQVKGAAESILPWLYEKGEVMNTLLISPPGCGKTTLLRDMIRLISNGNRYGQGKSVGIVDERSEIAGCYQGIPQNDVGMRTDVLDACPKALGMMLLLRSMSPQVIAIDELGGEVDVEAVRIVSSCGCKLLATVHGSNMEDVRRKNGMELLFKERIFDRFFLLGKINGKCSVLDMHGREFYDIEVSREHYDRDGLHRPGFLVSGAVSLKT